MTLNRVFPGGKGGRYVTLTTLPPSCAVVMKSGNLNFLEPSGPLQACNGTALPFTLNRIEEKCSLKLRPYLTDLIFKTKSNRCLLWTDFNF